MQSIAKNDQELLPIEPIEPKPVSGFLRAITSLKHRNFRLFWTGQNLSLIGTWTQSTGEAWLVLQLTHNAFMLGLEGALQFLPVMFFTLFGGVIADRIPKRRVLLFTQSFALLQAAILFFLVSTGRIQMWHMFVLATLLGINNALDMPTRQAFVSEMVGREDLPNAIALNSSMFNLARIVGPGISGLLIAWLGVAPLFLINALSFIPVLIGLAMIDTKQLHKISRPVLDSASGAVKNVWRSLGEGFVYIRKTTVVFVVIAIVGWVSLFGINFNVVLPLFATEVLNSGPTGYGFISSAFGAGALLSAIWLAWTNKQPGLSHIVLWTLFFCITEAIFALSHWYWISIILIMCVGFSQIAFAATANSTLQTMTPDYLRGRIMSVYMLFFVGTTPIGNLFTGGVARLFGTSIALLAGALISMIAAITGLIMQAWTKKSAVKESAIKVESNG
ncbi:MAG TPA: MFS transporter [Ktedonobacteraceae bacterium]|nr:MFS transporter [Ktedonobacteraceae bacterium]